MNPDVILEVKVPEHYKFKDQHWYKIFNRRTNRFGLGTYTTIEAAEKAKRTRLEKSLKKVVCKATPNFYEAFNELQSK